jgi:hypothetical protein
LKGKSVEKVAKQNPKLRKILQKLKELAPKDKYAREILAGLSLAGNQTYGNTQPVRLWWCSALNTERLTDILSTENFRAHAAENPANATLMARLESAGIKRWDDPTYVVYYFSNGQKRTESEIKETSDPLKVTNSLVMDFLGTMVDGKIIPGKLTGSLKHSVRSVYVDLRAQLAKLNSKELDREGCMYILSQLRAEHVKEGTDGEKALITALEALASKSPNFSGKVIEARIWHRNPWVDISYHEEFHCCGFGVGERAFNYLEDRGVTMLDFSTQKDGRICRAILAPVESESGLGLLVDSFEGTDRLNPELAYQAIKDYAKECNFDFLAINKKVLNTVPQKFVKHLEEKGLTSNENFAGKVLARENAFLEVGRKGSMNVLLEPLTNFSVAIAAPELGRNQPNATLWPAQA